MTSLTFKKCPRHFKSVQFNFADFIIAFNFSLGRALSYLIQPEALNWFPFNLSASHNSLEVKVGFPLQVSPDVKIYLPIEQILRRTEITVWLIFKQKSPQPILQQNY